MIRQGRRRWAVADHGSDNFFQQGSPDMSDERSDFTRKFLIGTLIGGLIGAVLGILYAPKSGKETREEVAARTRQIADQFREECGKALQKSKASQESLINRLKEQESSVVKRIERLLKKAGD